MSITGQKISDQISDFRFEDNASSITLSVVEIAKYALSEIDQIKIDNSINEHEVFLKIYDNAGPVVGTTRPDIRLWCGAGSIKYYSFIGLTTTNLQFICSKESIHTTNTAPVGDVKVVILAH